MEIFILIILLGLIPALIARHKGRSLALWWLYGAAIFIVALPHSLIMKTRGARKCPACAEQVKAEAKICKHCQTKLTPVATKPKKKESINEIFLFVALLLIGTVAALYFWPA